jgi:hypothetical protein
MFVYYFSTCSGIYTQPRWPPIQDALVQPHQRLVTNISMLSDISAGDQDNNSEPDHNLGLDIHDLSSSPESSPHSYSPMPSEPGSTHFIQRRRVTNISMLSAGDDGEKSNGTQIKDTDSPTTPNQVHNSAYSDPLSEERDFFSTINTHSISSGSSYQPSLPNAPTGMDLDNAVASDGEVQSDSDNIRGINSHREEYSQFILYN